MRAYQRSELQSADGKDAGGTAELKAKVTEGRKKLADEIRLACDARQWVEAIQEYADITELDAAP